MLGRLFDLWRSRVRLNINTIYQGHHQVTYRGVKTMRCPFDYVIYQMIISELQPDLIIEIGTNQGGGTLYLADLLALNGSGVVHTIDIVNIAHPLLAGHPRISMFTEGWQGYNLAEAHGFERVLVIEDSTHLYLDTLQVLRKFSPLVSPGSYFIVEDGIINALGMRRAYQGGPLRAINAFLAHNRDFVIDRRWCDLFGKNATFNVNGYLRRR